MYGLNLERRIMDKFLYEIDNSDISELIITVRFVTFFVNWYNNRLLLLIRQFFLIPKELMSLWVSHSIISPPA
jgi:hypothetical protein